MNVQHFVMQEIIHKFMQLIQITGIQIWFCIALLFLHLVGVIWISHQNVIKSWEISDVISGNIQIQWKPLPVGDFGSHVAFLPVVTMKTTSCYIFALG